MIKPEIINHNINPNGKHSVIYSYRDTVVLKDLTEGQYKWLAHKAAVSQAD